MPSPPFASLTVSIAGGAPATGAVTALNGQTCQLAAASTAFWQTAKWEIFAFPSGFSVPAGWTDDTLGTYYFLGIGPPPVFNLPAIGTWGKFLFRLTVNNGLTNGVADATLKDESTAVEILSSSGLHDIAAGESTQFSSIRKWVKSLQDNWRTIDLAITGGGGGDTKASARALIPTNVASLSSCSTSQDGLTLVAGNRVLLVGQSTGRDNGIYVVGTPSGGNAPLTRATDMDESAEVTCGLSVYIEEGTNYLGTRWTLTTANPITLGSTTLVFNPEPVLLGGTTLQWSPAVTTPTIKQGNKTTNSGTGETLTIQAQNETGTTSTGGKLSLVSGSGTSSNGSIEFKSGSTTLGITFLQGSNDWRYALDAGMGSLTWQANGASQAMFFQALGASGAIWYQTPTVQYADGAAATTATWNLNATGATSLAFATGITGLTIKQNDLTTNSGTGATTTIQAQNETGTTSVGGALATTSGTGTSRHGANRMQIGGTTNVEIAQVVASQTVVALARNANLTSTEMPSNSGDKVIYIGNAATAPTANSVSGIILYSESGILKYRDTSGFIVTI